MELDITDFFNATEDKASLYSASRAELGPDAAQITWEAALEAALGSGLLTTSDEREAFEAFVLAFGAWDDEEVKGWSDDKCRALLVQFISGDMRESEQRAEAGDISSRLFRGTNDRIYYYIGE